MTSTTSSNKLLHEIKTVYLWSFRKRFGIVALFCGMAFLCLPLPVFLMLNEDQQRQEHSRSWLTQDGVTRMLDLGDKFIQYLGNLMPWLFTPLILLMILLLAALLFGYLHTKRSVDLFHAVPIRRESLLLGKFLAGMTMVAIPVVFSFVSLFAVLLFFSGNVGSFGGAVAMMATHFLWLLFMAAAAFAFTIVMAVCSGTTFDMVISTIVISVTYPLMIMMGDSIASRLLPGYSGGALPELIYTAFSPYAAAIIPQSYGFSSFPLVFFLWWLLMTVVMLVGAVLLYKRRKSECAESSFAFPLPQNTIRFVATMAAAFTGGKLFLNTLGDASSFFIGAAVASIFTHVVAQAIYGRGFRGLKRSFGYYGIFLAVFGIFFGSLATGFFGYDTRIPNTADIKSVTTDINGVVNNIQVYDFIASGFAIYNSEDYPQVYVRPEYKQPETITAATELHQFLTATIRESGYPYHMTGSAYLNLDFTYQLKDGKTLDRNYYYMGAYLNNNNFEELKRESNAFANQPEYKTSGNWLYYVAPEFIDNITVTSGGEGEQEGVVMSPSKEDIQKLLEAIRADWEAYQYGLEGEPQDELAPAISETEGTVAAEPTKQQEFVCNINFETKLAPAAEGSKIKEAIGDYTKPVRPDSKHYSIPQEFTRTIELLKANKWLK